MSVVPEIPEIPEIKPCYVYCLQSTSGCTYVGATVDLDRRLRQHNGTLSGGARATKARVNKGELWKRVCYVKNFPNWTAALQFEWRWKQLARREPKRLSGLDKRRVALDKLLAMERSTTAAIPFAGWGEAPEVVWETMDENVVVD